MNLNIYVFFAGNQLFNCRKRILEFKENILHLKNQTKRNHQELIRVLSRIKYGVRKNLSRNLGLCRFCFCFSFYSLCLEIQILRFLVWGHFSPINITKSVLILLLWDTEKSGKRLWYTSSHLPLERGRPVVFLSVNRATVHDPPKRRSQKPEHQLWLLPLPTGYFRAGHEAILLTRGPTQLTKLSVFSHHHLDSPSQATFMLHLNDDQHALIFSLSPVWSPPILAVAKVKATLSCTSTFVVPFLSWIKSPVSHLLLCSQIPPPLLTLGNHRSVLCSYTFPFSQCHTKESYSVWPYETGFIH